MKGPTTEREEIAGLLRAAAAAFGREARELEDARAFERASHRVLPPSGGPAWHHPVPPAEESAVHSYSP